MGGLLLPAVVSACTTTRTPTDPSPSRRPPPSFETAPLGAGSVRVEAERRTVERSWILTLYTWLHDREYSSYRITFPSVDGEEAVGHMLLPPGRGPHPGVLVFPILAGSHVVSEGLAKALVDRRFAVLRLERRGLDLDRAQDFDGPATRLEQAVLDARRIVAWFGDRPEVDEGRLAVAGISLGGILAATLLGIEPRVRAGFLVLTGGGVAEILYDSREKPVRRFRDRLMEARGLETREQFLAAVRPSTERIDPLRYAQGVDPRSVLLASGRFDRVVPPDRTQALWEALGRPVWIRLPVGHYQLFPFFWWAAGRGADHLERTLWQAGAGLQTHTSSAEEER